MASMVSSQASAEVKQHEEEVSQELPDFLQQVQECAASSLFQADIVKKLQKGAERIPRDITKRLTERLALLKSLTLDTCAHLKHFTENNVRLAHSTEETKKSYSQLYSAARKVVEAGKVLAPQLESKEGVEFNASIHQLEMMMKHHVDKGGEAAEVRESKEIPASNPHILPQTEKLLTDLETLCASLQTMSKDIANPEAETQIPELKKALSEKDGSFAEFIAIADSLSKSIKRKLSGLGRQIEAYNMHTIPEEHLKSIALYERSTKKGVMAELEKRKAVHEQRLAQHDKLAAVWALCLIRKEAIADKLWHIDKHTSTRANVVQLAQKLGELSKTIGELKEYLRSQKNPETKLEKAKSDFRAVQTTYWQLKSLEKEYKDDVDKLIKKDLPEIIGKESMSLREQVEALVIFDPTKKKDIVEELSGTVKAISEEQKSVLRSMTTAWESVQKMLYDEFYREVNRLGFAIFENEGQVPFDWTYTLGLRKSAKDYTAEKQNEEIMQVKEKKE